MWFKEKENKDKEFSVAELNQMLNSSKSQREIAFTYIYNKYSNQLYAYCIRVTDNKSDADDLFQETFSSFLNPINGTFDLKNISAYLIKTARNLELNNKRFKRKYDFNIKDFEILLFTDEKDKYDRKEEKELIAKALEMLDFHYREIIVLRQYQNLDYEEIAEITNEKIKPLRMRYFRAKLKLKEILEPILKEKINI